MGKKVVAKLEEICDNWKGPLEVWFKMRNAIRRHYSDKKNKSKFDYNLCFIDDDKNNRKKLSKRKIVWGKQ